MSQDLNGMEAFTETQLLPKLDGAGTAPAGPTIAELLAPGPVPTATAGPKRAAPAPGPTQPPSPAPALAPPKSLRPPKGFDKEPETRSPAPANGAPASASVPFAAGTRPSAPPAEAPASADPVTTTTTDGSGTGPKGAGTPKPPAKPDSGGFNGPPRWQEHVPFDETGVLLRPEALRQHAMQAETELISAIKDESADDGSEAAQSQRPGFWTGAWARRSVVGGILALQAILSLRNNNSAFEDEALYLYSGHLELGHLLNGTSTGTDFWSYFSGAPVLYPVLGSIADQVGGLFAARLLSLLCLLATTGLLYLLSRRLFGTRAAVCAAMLYSCTEPVVFVGNLATYDAPALFLIALSAWLVVRFARSVWPWYLLAIFPMALAVGTKYAALMFVPAVIALAWLTSAPHSGRWALVRPVALVIGLSVVLYSALKIAGPDALKGIEVTTTSRAQGADGVTKVLDLAGQWGGCVFAVSLAGAVFLILPRRNRQLTALPSTRWQRVCLVLVLCGTAVMVPVYQAHLHTTVALQKHVGFGLFFVAPLAGYGLVRVVGPHFHRAQLGIGIIVLTFALGMGQSLALFHGWPNSDALVSQIVKYQKPGAAYLVGADEVAIYALRGDPDAEPLQFTNTFFFSYTTAKGQYLTGPPAYTAAIQAGYFQVIAYTGNDDPANEGVIAADLYRSTTYRLVATIPEPTSYGMSHYYVWVHK